MQYPKPVMKISELKKMGFPEDFLLSAFRRKGQKFAWKTSSANNSHILFDTEEFERYRRACCG